MKLIKLSCDQKSFHPLIFAEEGLTLILGEGSSNNDANGNSNGVGKTLALGLVHHCLGAKADKKLAAAVPDWIFSLTFRIQNNRHTIKRSGDGRTIYLDDETITYKRLQEWLNKCGVFRINSNISFLTFRSLFKRFMRHAAEDCLDPARTNKEQPYQALLRTLFLLGLDCSLATRKHESKILLDDIGKKLKIWNDNSSLKEIFRTGAKPQVRLDYLEREIPRLENDLNRFQIAEDYRILEAEAGSLTKQLKDIKRQIEIIRFQNDSIEKSLVKHPDITKNDLLSLYQGLQEIFRPDTLAHFDAVENFHNSLSINRKARLQKDYLQNSNKIQDLEKQKNDIEKNRDSKLELLSGKRALDEYAAIANKLANMKEEKIRLFDFLNYTTQLQAQTQQIRERRIEDDRITTDYLTSSPISHLNDKFIELANIMYPRTPAGIVLTNNTGENQIRYDLTINIEGDDSDGIDAAKIICFDWIIFMHGSHHAMDVLWHDNRLFADIYPKSRAAWFSNLINELKGTGKQYIASLNKENFEAMFPFLSDEIKLEMEKSIKLKLRDDGIKDKGIDKLLGIQFGNPQK